MAISPDESGEAFDDGRQTCRTVKVIRLYRLAVGVSALSDQELAFPEDTPARRALALLCL